MRLGGISNSAAEVELQADCCSSPLYNKAAAKPPYQVACQIIDFFLSNEAAALDRAHVDNESTGRLTSKGHRPCRRAAGGFIDIYPHCQWQINNQFATDNDSLLAYAITCLQSPL